MSKSSRNIYSDIDDLIAKDEYTRKQNATKIIKDNELNKKDSPHLFFITCVADRYYYYKINSLLTNLCNKNTDSHFIIYTYMYKKYDVPSFYNYFDTLELNNTIIKNFRICNIHEDDSKFTINIKKLRKIYKTYQKKYNNVEGLHIIEDDGIFNNSCYSSTHVFNFDVNDPDICPKYENIEKYFIWYK